MRTFREEGTVTSSVSDRARLGAGDRAVLFAFDDHAMPWRYRVRLQMHRPEKHAGNPILPRGPAGAVDSRRMQCCPVVHDGERFRMWYIARDDGSGGRGRAAGSYADVDPEVVNSYDTGRICYAESDDGLTWTRPELGLVEYGGSRSNNIVDLPPGSGNMDILYQPDAPAERRYLMVNEYMAWRHRSGSALERPSITLFAASPDGLRWTMLRDEPGAIGQHFECSCLYRYRGNYHVAGHIAPPMAYAPLQRHPAIWMVGAKMMAVWRSPTIDAWPLEMCVGFFKPMRSSSPYRTGWDREENHLGAYVIPYPNVCLAVTGQWHHPITDAPPEHPDYLAEQASADLGFAYSEDGVHFKEPAPGFTFVPRDQEMGWDRDFRDNTSNDHLLMIQGPMVNAGEETFIYYTAFTPTGDRMEGLSNLGLARMPRERFGSLVTVPDAPFGQVVTAVLGAAPETSLAANAVIDAGGQLQAALLDSDGLTELPGFTLADSVPIRASGLAQPIVWKGRERLPDSAFRLRLRLTGARLFAVELHRGTVDTAA